MKKLLITLVFFYVNIFSQTHYIQGHIFEAETKKPLVAANIIITGITNNSVNGIASDTKGKFQVDGLEKGTYSLKISYVGYNSYIDTIEVSHSIDLEDIYLKQAEVQIGDVEVVEKAIPVVMNEDTTEYNADAFTTHKNATAEDLLSKMPGITVDDGSVETQGETVTKIVVDGKEFFSNDPNAVLKNIPAEMVEKFQVYDKKSDQAEFTGFDDGNTTKTINIVTRREFRKGVFGKGAGGYGSEDRYLAGLNLNIFNHAQRMTVIGQINNINQQNFSSSDILGVMSSGRDNQGRGSGSIRMSGGGSSSSGLIGSQSGLAKSKYGGINYNNQFAKKLRFSGDYFYNNTDNNTESYVDRDYLLTSNNQNYIEEGVSNSQNTNHRAYLRMDYSIDSSNSIRLEPTLTTQNNKSINSTSGTTYSDSGMVNSKISDITADLSALTSSSSLLLLHKFEKKRRTISVNLSGDYDYNNGDRYQYTENTYYNSQTSDTVDQHTLIDNNSYNAEVNINYTEPAGKWGMLKIGSEYSYSKDRNDQKIFDLAQNALMDTSLSNVYSKEYSTQQYSIGYNFNKKPYMLSATIEYAISDLSGAQKFPYTFSIDKKFYSWLPSVMFNYNISRNRRFSFFYRAQNNSPSITQLQNVLDNSNTLQLSIGNPGLNQAYSHNIAGTFFTSKPSKSISFFLRFNGIITQNYIANNTIVAENDTTVFDGIELKQGVQIKKPVNLSGYVSLNTFMSYGFPLYLLKSTMSLDANIRYSRTPSLYNSVKNYSNSTTGGLGVSINSNVSEDVDFSVRSNTKYSSVVNSTKEENDKSYLNQDASLKVYWNIWKGFVFQSEFQYSYEGGLSDDYDPNSYTWNLSLGKTLFENERGEVRFSVYDVLDQSSSIQRNVTDTYTEDRQTNIIGQFFLVSFIYNLRTFY